MTQPTSRFVDSCPVCGRGMRIPVQLLGHRAQCPHCNATFVARSGADRESRRPSDDLALLRRAEALLGAASTH